MVTFGTNIYNFIFKLLNNLEARNEEYRKMSR